jgi:hypothetical protein
MSTIMFVNFLLCIHDRGKLIPYNLVIVGGHRGGVLDNIEAICTPHTVPSLFHCTKNGRVHVYLFIATSKGQAAVALPAFFVIPLLASSFAVDCPNLT